MKIVVLDGYTENPGDLSWEELGQLGELTVYERTDKADIVPRIGDAQLVITNKTPVTREILDQCPGLRYIGVLATGYNVVDTQAAREKGITVTNVPAYGTETVGQYTIALLLEICCHVGHHSAEVHQGRWENSVDFCFWDYPLIELYGKTIGIIGCGKIGQATGRIAQAMGMRVLAYASHKRPELESEACRYAELDELLEQSDVIALHCPLFPETKEIINEDTIEKMKDGVIIINSARGQLINEEALAAALKKGKVQAAGLDVVSEEPIKSTNPLLKAPNCIITPHIAWASKEARRRLMDIAVDNVRQFLAGTPANVVK